MRDGPYRSTTGAYAWDSISEDGSLTAYFWQESQPHLETLADRTSDRSPGANIDRHCGAMQAKCGAGQKTPNERTIYPPGRNFFP